MFKQSASGEKKWNCWHEASPRPPVSSFFHPNWQFQHLSQKNGYMKHSEKLTFSKNYIKNCHFYCQFQEKPAEKKHNFPVKTQQMQIFSEKNSNLEPFKQLAK